MDWDMMPPGEVSNGRRRTVAVRTTKDPVYRFTPRADGIDPLALVLNLYAGREGGALTRT